ncbi:class I SAM-dependent methyltransferase [Gammaproteobacteria bacterium]|nr:class I SAM-dependent methyltransferase [Gammaproteobacteria bacterium]
MTKINEVHDFWNSESCGERHAEGNSEIERYNSQEQTRYKLEPYILNFACFNDFQNLDVLEIGVGFGADHSRIAQSGPKSLVGVDLTQRAIDNTKVRFELLGLKSNLKTDNAENLSFEDSSFDAVYSWGVLHHSPNTEKCFEEVYRVLRPGGFAKIMVYNKHAPTGWMLWLRYGLLKLRPFIGLQKIYSSYLESPGTKAYSIGEARLLAKSFPHFDVSIELCTGDLLEADAGARHKGILLSVARVIYPRFLIRLLSRFFPIGLFMLITVRK